MRKNLFNYFLFVFLVSLFAISSVFAYTNSNPNYGLFESYVRGQTEVQHVCTAGQDFLIQIAPFGCTPLLVRSDLLEEQNVPVFCQLSATKINPLINVEAIDSVSFSGSYPKEVSGVGFHPAQAALGVRGQINSPVLNNIGYVVIILKQQANESDMSDFVNGTLTAKIKYNIKNAFGVGPASFYLPELTESQWQETMGKYAFWNRKGYIRAGAIDVNGAVISVSDGRNIISSFTLKEGQTSSKVYLPGFDCLASLQVRLDGLEVPGIRAKLKVNGEVVELVKGEKFLENRCIVRDIIKQGVVQKVSIVCNEDSGSKTFELMISPRIRLSVDGEEREVSVGDFLYKTSDGLKSVYLGYVGTARNTGKLTDLYARLISTPQFKDKLSDSEIASISGIDGYLNTQNLGKGLIADLNNLGRQYIGQTIQIGKQIVESKDYEFLPYATKEEGFKDIFGKKLKIMGFAGTVDVKDYDETTPNAKLFLDYLQKSRADYGTIKNSFPNEKESSTSPVFGELALAEEIMLLSSLNQKQTMSELCNQFKEKYSDSDYLPDECDNQIKMANSLTSDRDILINGKFLRVSFDGVYEPTWDEFGAEIVVRDSTGTIKSFYLVKDQIEYLDSANTEYIQLLSLDDDIAKVSIHLSSKTVASVAKGYIFSETKTIKKGTTDTFGSNYAFTLTRVNLKKVAKVSVIPGIDYAGTETNFSFGVGIEKRAIKLSPEQTREKIEKLNSTINSWKDRSEKLDGVLKGFKGACLGVGATLTVKNFLSNTDGKAIARQNVMRNKGGWNDKCASMVGAGTYSSREQCMVENSNAIDADVESYYQVLQTQNDQLKKLQEGVSETTFFGETKVNTDALKNNYLTDSYRNELKENLKAKYGGDTMTIGAETVNIDDFVNNLRTNLSSVEELRDLQMYSRLGGNLDDLAKANLNSKITDIYTRTKNEIRQVSFVEDLSKKGLNNLGSIDVYGPKGSEEGVYDGGKTGSVSFGDIPPNSPIKAIIYNHQQYLLLLSPPSSIGGYYTISGVYNSDGFNLEQKGEDLNKVAEEIKKRFKGFKAYDSSSYKNKYLNPQLKYYETDPYKDLPATVPFDLTNGWYASVKQTLPVLGNLKAYDDSGRITSFYLCNVGQNGREEDRAGDDICEMVNFATGQPYNVFPGLNKIEATKIVQNAVKAVEQASKIPVSQRKGFVNILGQRIQVGSPAVNVPDIQCQDFMSPDDCQLLFNVCDPVICPSSRCNFGGSYTVQDVVQSGIIGSIALCLPNFKDGIYVPVCLTGIKAGIDGLLSVFESYRTCLQDSLNTGKMVGVCDELYSVYLCDFFWRQTLPLTKMVVPKIVEIALGQNVRGGGEYMGVASAWDAAGKSADYFVQYYASNSYDAFKARVAEKVQATACKSFLSVSYPDSGSLLDTLTAPDSPPQFHGRFDEIPFTTATVPPVSHYKVYYHIYAGKGGRAAYSVYLKGASETSFYQDTSLQKVIDSGYIATGESVDQTKDFTAPAGYKQLCIRVNNQEECGFNSVSTDFAVNYVKDQYTQSQASQTGITTETGCIAGTASPYDLLSPNLQSSAENLANPSLYNAGIIRICATESPGKGTDPYAGTATARWKEVGYCGDQKIKCWIDTQTVSDVIKNLDIQNETLSVLTNNSLAVLGAEGVYLEAGVFPNKVDEINKAKTPEEKINLVNSIYNKVFFNNQKAHLLYLRGNAYSELAIKVYNSLTKISRTVTPVVTSGGTQLSREKLLRVQGIIDGSISVPVYAEIPAEGQWCAWYAKLATADLFEKVYNSADAWCRKQAGDKVVYEFSSASTTNNQELINLKNSNVLQPGMIVATRPLNAGGPYFGKEFSCGVGRGSTLVGYTHNMVYLGTDNSGDLVFIESYFSSGPSRKKLSEFGTSHIAMAIFDAPAKTGAIDFLRSNGNPNTTPVAPGTITPNDTGIFSSIGITLNDAIIAVKGSSGSYSDGANKVLIDQLCSQRTLSEIDCNEIKGDGVFNLEENMAFVLKILEEKANRPAWTLENAVVKLDDLIKKYGEVTYTGNVEIETFVEQLKRDDILKRRDVGITFSPWDLATLKNILLETYSTESISNIPVKAPPEVENAVAKLDELIKKYGNVTYTGNVEVETFVSQLEKDGILKEEDVGITFSPWDLATLRKLLLKNYYLGPARTPWTIDSALLRVDSLLKQNAPADIIEKFRQELISDKILIENDFAFLNKDLNGIKTALIAKKL